MKFTVEFGITGGDADGTTFCEVAEAFRKTKFHITIPYRQSQERWPGARCLTITPLSVDVNGKKVKR